MTHHPAPTRRLASRFALLIALLAAVAPTARGQTAATQPADPVTAISADYAPYLDPADPLALDMKLRSLATDEYKFWRGSKDLFFIWCKSNCRDWMADKQSYVINHGDLHVGNIGTYMTEDGLGQLAFGMVDFDESTRLPFQLELLQGMITLDLIARQNQIALTPADRAALDATLLATYRKAVNSQRNATQLLKDDPIVAGLLAEAGKKPYDKELAKYCDEGKFRPAVGKKAGLTDILQAVEAKQIDAFAQGLADAVAGDEDLAARLRYRTADAFRSAVLDAARRTRLGSSGSQGLGKYLLLLKRPLVGSDSDAILYLKQEIPTAAERSGLVAQQPGVTPGRRLKIDMDHLTDPRPFLNGSVEAGGQSYWLSLKEPWSDEIAFDDAKTPADLQQLARIWGSVAGATHRDDGRYEKILPRLTPALAVLLRTRAEVYLADQAAAFARFSGDARVTAAAERAQTAIDRLTAPAK